MQILDFLGVFRVESQSYNPLSYHLGLCVKKYATIVMEVPILRMGWVGSGGLPKTTPACGLSEICNRGDSVEIQRPA